MALDVLDEEVERGLGVGLDHLELRERVLERLDVVAVLDLVEPLPSIQHVTEQPTAFALRLTLADASSRRITIRALAPDGQMFFVDVTIAP